MKVEELADLEVAEAFVVEELSDLNRSLGLIEECDANLLRASGLGGRRTRDWEGAAYALMLPHPHVQRHHQRRLLSCCRFLVSTTEDWLRV